MSETKLTYTKYYCNYHSYRSDRHHLLGLLGMVTINVSQLSFSQVLPSWKAWARTCHLPPSQGLQFNQWEVGVWCKEVEKWTTKPKKQSNTESIQNHGTFLPVFAAFIGRNLEVLEVLLKLSDRELAANLGSSVPHCRCGQQKNTKEANSQKFHKSLVVEICPVGTPSTTLALLYCTSWLLRKWQENLYDKSLHGWMSHDESYSSVKRTKESDYIQWP